MGKPRLVVSACLLGEKVRYDGNSAEDTFVVELARSCDVIPVCPEVSIGLGVPREKIIVYTDEEGFGLFQPGTGRDLTEDIKTFSKDFLTALPQVDGFILKSRSPSCGVSRTKTYEDPTGRIYRGPGRGLFASEILKRYPYYPVEDEVRLKSGRRRALFLAKLYALFTLRTDPIKLELLLKTLGLWSLKEFRRIKGEVDTENIRSVMLRVLEYLPRDLLEEIYINLSETS